MKLCKLIPPHIPQPTQFGTTPIIQKFDMSSCTSQGPPVDTATGWNAFVCSHSWGVLLGHANYRPATFEGRIFWESKSSVGADDDYNLLLAPPRGEALTTASSAKWAFEVEFDSD